MWWVRGSIPWQMAFRFPWMSQWRIVTGTCDKKPLPNKSASGRDENENRLDGDSDVSEDEGNDPGGGGVRGHRRGGRSLVRGWGHEPCQPAAGAERRETDHSRPGANDPRGDEVLEAGMG